MDYMNYGDNNNFAWVLKHFDSSSSYNALVECVFRQGPNVVG